MKVLFPTFVCAFLSFAAAQSSGQEPNWRTAIRSDPRFSFTAAVPEGAPKHVPIVSDWTLRSLDEKFARDAGSPDFISAGLKSIEDNFKSRDLFEKGFSWSPDADSSFRLKSKLTFTYNPVRFPNSPLMFLDKAFFNPLRYVAGKTFRF